MLCLNNNCTCNKLTDLVDHIGNGINNNYRKNSGSDNAIEQSFVDYLRFSTINTASFILWFTEHSTY